MTASARPLRPSALRGASCARSSPRHAGHAAAALDQTIVGPALPTIGRELGVFSCHRLGVTAYLLSATAVTPIYGKLSDLYGRRQLLLAGIALFASARCSARLAPSMVLLIVARALQGAGAAG